MAQRRLSPNFNTKGAAEYLCVKPATLKMWRKLGTGPPFCRVNRRILYPVDALGKWLAERTVYPGELTDHASFAHTRC